MKHVPATVIVGFLIGLLAYPFSSRHAEAYPWGDTRATCRAACGDVQESVGKTWFDLACGQYFGFRRKYPRCKRRLILQCRMHGSGYTCPHVTTTTTTTTIPSVTLSVGSLTYDATCYGRPAQKFQVTVCAMYGAQNVSLDEEHFALTQGPDTYDATIAELDTAIGAALAPYRTALAHLVTIPGVSTTAEQILVTEIGTDMSRFLSYGRAAGW
jgi:hypothetical protein